jgi:hypothetical protein
MTRGRQTIQKSEIIILGCCIFTCDHCHLQKAVHNLPSRPHRCSRTIGKTLKVATRSTSNATSRQPTLVVEKARNFPAPLIYNYNLLVTEAIKNINEKEKIISVYE